MLFGPNSRCTRAALIVFAFAQAMACRVLPENGGWERNDAPTSLATGPYIVRAGPTSAYVVMRVKRATAEPVVEWWLAKDGVANGEPENAKQVTAILSEDIYVATLEDLPSFERIHYRVKVGKQTSANYDFRIGAAPGERFRFAVFGDTRTRHGVHAAVIDQVVQEDVDFVVHTGDMVQRGGVRELWDLFFQIERPLLATAPIFASIGNHDYSRRGYYERYFLIDRTAGNRRYYYSDWGNLRLVAVDGGIEGRKGSQQYAFAARALKEAADRGMFSMMYLHWPPYSSGKHGSQLNVREPLAALARKYGVELIVTGHDHMYERTIPIEGTTYIVSGSAGAPTRNFSTSWFTANARTEPHYVVVDVEPTKLSIRAVNLNGIVFDSTILEDNPPKTRTATR